jgi:oxygen-independent coproporphyrinogen-3 oxidase
MANMAEQLKQTSERAIKNILKDSAMDVEKFFDKSLQKMYGFELQLAKLLGFVTEKDGVYEMTLKGAFYYHYYENFYTLAYIDKMWGIMRKEAFPERIEL